MHSPSEDHMNAVLRILRYLKSAPGKGLMFSKHGHLNIDGYSDADWAVRFLLSITLLLVHYSSIGIAGATQTDISTDQFALLALKSHITSDPHIILVYWSTTTSVCNWVGVTYAARQLRVASLNLSYM
ncbi:unnamed protein product, partial [Prunus brigantina]